MGPHGTEPSAKVVDDSTPEDVAALYRWANLTGAKYRDYSAERREQRARMRYQAAKQQLGQELERQTLSGADTDEERVREAPQGESAAGAALRAYEEEREIVEAHESARRKQAAFREAERLRRERTGNLLGEKTYPAELNPIFSEAEHMSRLISQVRVPPVVQTAAEEALAAIRPAWLEPATEPAWPEETIAFANSSKQNTSQLARRPSVETLLESREHVALRWPALQALAKELRRTIAGARMSPRRGPVTAVVSPAGGAGATSLAAALARALVTDGERVLLVETVPQSLLPLYFGLGPLVPGELRTVTARADVSGAASIAAFDAASFVLADATERYARQRQEAAIETLLDRAQGFDRIVIDLSPEAEWMVHRLAALRPMVLAPVAPEMSSVAGLQALEQRFAAIRDSEGGALLPFYVLNLFDAGLPLHLDIREVLRRELDGRLLAVAVRRSASVGEALAQGKTVLEYAPESPVARDYGELARWMAEAAPASAEAIAGATRGKR